MHIASHCDTKLYSIRLQDISPIGQSPLGMKPLPEQKSSKANWKFGPWTARPFGGILSSMRWDLSSLSVYQILGFSIFNRSWFREGFQNSEIRPLNHHHHAPFGVIRGILSSMKWDLPRSISLPNF